MLFANMNLPGLRSRFVAPFERPHQRLQMRRGIAATEAAITLPVIVLLVFGMLQICHTIYLRQRMTAACYIGMQQMSQSDASDTTVIKTVQDLLAARSVQGANVTILPAGMLGVATLPQVYVLRVQAPMVSNLPPPRLIPMSGNVVVEQSLYK